jgi:hypothetical protein
MVSTSTTNGANLLRIALPNKGALSTAASEMLREAGYRQRSDSKELTLLDTANGVEFFYLRPRDIALYVGEGTLDIGITWTPVRLRLSRCSSGSDVRSFASQRGLAPWRRWRT